MDKGDYNHVYIKQLYKNLTENPSNFKFKIDKEGFDAFNAQTESMYEFLTARLKTSAASLGVPDFNYNSVSKREAFFTALGIDCSAGTGKEVWSQYLHLEDVEFFSQVEELENLKRIVSHFIDHKSEYYEESDENMMFYKTELANIESPVLRYLLPFEGNVFFQIKFPMLVPFMLAVLSEDKALEEAINSGADHFLALFTDLIPVDLADNLEHREKKHYIWEFLRKVIYGWAEKDSVYLTKFTELFPKAALWIKQTQMSQSKDNFCSVSTFTGRRIICSFTEGEEDKRRFNILTGSAIDVAVATAHHVQEKFGLQVARIGTNGVVFSGADSGFMDTIDDFSAKISESVFDFLSESVSFNKRLLVIFGTGYRLADVLQE